MRISEIQAKIEMNYCEHKHGECYCLYDLDEDGIVDRDYSTRISGINPVDLNVKAINIPTSPFNIDKIAVYYGDKWIRLDKLIGILAGDHNSKLYHLTDEDVIKITRKWIQWNCKNGDSVEWGSETPIDITPNKLQRFAFELLGLARDLAIEGDE
jgi:hypothetical protein